MKIGVLGTGVVGKTLAGRLVGLGHEVVMGSRRADNEEATGWAAETGAGASHGTFADAAAFGDLLVNATSGGASLAVLDLAGADNVAGKVIVDVANALDFSAGFPPTLSVCNTDSLGEQIQRQHPTARVVKTLNTVNADVMVHPNVIAGSHTMFLCGDDAGAKKEVRALLESFGWPPGDLLDVGDISAARGLEMFVPLWLRLTSATGTWYLNVKVAVPASSPS